ncbi:MAG: hypothetical protein ACOY93_19530 [Bacillota bacterium]
MGERTRFHVTHSFAPDPDHRKVEAALGLWAAALAERALVEHQGPDLPIARLHFGPKTRRRVGRRAENS